MKKIFLRFTTFLLGMIMCASLAACGGGGGFERTYTIDDPWWNTTGTLQKDGNNVVFDDVYVDLVTVVTGPDYTTFEKLVNRFNTEYKDKITVNITQMNDSSFETTVASNIVNNSNAPDLIMSHQKGQASLVENKLIQPFDEAMEKSGIEIKLEDYSSSLTQYSSLGYEGYLFSLPIDVRSQVAYYNKKLLNKYGGELPETRSELIALCKSAASGEGNGFIPIAIDTSFDSKYFSTYSFPTAIVQNGGHFYDDTFRADWASDATNLKAFKDAVQSMKELTEAPKLMDYGMSASAALGSFLSNKALFYISVPWELKEVISAYGKENNNLTDAKVMEEYIGGTSLSGWFALDENAECADYVFGDAHCFSMSRTVTDINKKAAMLEFMKWYTQTVSVGTAWAEAGHMSASTIVVNDPAYIENAFVENFINKFYSDINKIECLGLTPYFNDTITGLAALFVSTQSTATEAATEAAIRDAQDSVNEVIDFIEM